jgi:hypothetical protein
MSEGRSESCRGGLIPIAAGPLYGRHPDGDSVDSAWSMHTTHAPYGTYRHCAPWLWSRPWKLRSAPCHVPCQCRQRHGAPVLILVLCAINRSRRKGGWVYPRRVGPGKHRPSILPRAGSPDQTPPPGRTSATWHPAWHPAFCVHRDVLPRTSWHMIIDGSGSRRCCEGLRSRSSAAGTALHLCAAIFCTGSPRGYVAAEAL